MLEVFVFLPNALLDLTYSPLFVQVKLEIGIQIALKEISEIKAYQPPLFVFRSDDFTDGEMCLRNSKKVRGGVADKILDF